MRQMVMEVLRPAPRPWMMLVGAVGLAALIRAVGLGDRPLWLDEAFSVLYARLDPSTLFQLLRHGTNPPLYHLLLSLWVELFGSSEAGLRSLSAMAGTAAVGLLFLLGRSIGGTAVGLLSTGLLTFSSMAVGYSQEARFYALVEMLAVASSLMLRSAVTSGRGSRMAGYALVMIVFVWTHTFAWFVLAAHAAALACALSAAQISSVGRRRLAKSFGLAVMVVVASFLPWVGIFVSQVGTVLGGYWVPRPTAAMLLACTHGFVVPLEALRWPAVAAASLGGMYAWRRNRRGGGYVRRGNTATRFDWLMLWTWATLPVGVPLLWSLVGTPIFQPKYAIVAQPAMLILLSLLIVRRPSIALLVVAALTAVRAPAPNRGLQIEDWRRAAAIIEAGGQQDVPVYVCQDFTYFALAYYIDEERYPVTPVIVRGGRPGCFAKVYSRPALSYEEWLDRLRRDGRAWVVLSRLRGIGEQSAMEEVLADLQELGSLRVWPVRGDVDVLFLGTEPR